MAQIGIIDTVLFLLIPDFVGIQITVEGQENDIILIQLYYPLQKETESTFMVTDSTDLKQFTNPICLPYTTINANHHCYVKVARQVNRKAAVSTKRGSFLYMENDMWVFTLSKNGVLACANVQWFAFHD